MYKYRTQSHIKEYNCVTCLKGFQTSIKHIDGYCSPHCRKIARNVIKFVGTEGIDYITCPICNIRTRQISPGHARMHGFDSAKNMQESLQMILITCKSKKELTAGENNPGFQHGGKYSHFSKNFINGYDEEKHKKLISDNRNRNINQPELFKTNIAYWLKETNGDELLAKQLYLKFQIRDLSWFVEKYGEKDGIIRHQAKIDKWLNTLQSKSIEELLDINRRKVRKSMIFFSKSEKEIFLKLKLLFPEITDQYALCYNEQNKKRFYLYDMKLGNKIIEYNGDFWHANPKIFNESFINPYTKLSFNEIHERDAKKINTAIINGYEILVIWESNFKENPEKVIEECIQFLKQ